MINKTQTITVAIPEKFQNESDTITQQKHIPGGISVKARNKPFCKLIKL